LNDVPGLAQTESLRSWGSGIPPIADLRSAPAPGIFPSALPLAIRSAASKLVGIITGKLEKLSEVRALAIAHQTAAGQDACCPLWTQRFERFGTHQQRKGDEAPHQE
jgi:hypothetical protein